MWMIKRAITFSILLVLVCGFTRIGKPESVPFSGKHPYQDPDCVAYYRCNSGGANGATMSDVSRFGNTVTVGGSPNTIPTSTTVPPGWKGTSLDFEQGDSEWMEATDSASLDINRDQVTFMCWYRMESAQTSSQTILSKDVSLGYWVRPSSIETFGVSGLTTTPDGLFNESFILAINTWYHLAWVYDGQNASIYINGTLLSKQKMTGRINATTTAFRIGSDNAGFNGLDGLLDDIIIFRRGLTKAEIDYVRMYGGDSSKGANG